MKSNHTKLSYIERDFMGFIFRWPSSSLAIPPQQYTMMMIMTNAMMVMVAMIIMIVMTKQMVDLIWWWAGMPTAYFSGTFAPTTLLQVKAAIQGFSHVGLLYRNYSILLDIQSRFISRPNILTLEYACLCVCVCVCDQKTPSNTLSTAAPKLDSG